MSASTILSDPAGSDGAAQLSTAAHPPQRRRRRRWRRAAIAVVVAAVVGGGAVASDRLSDHSASSGDASADASSGAALADVKQQAIAARIQANGTLGYAGKYDVVNQSAGTITALPSVGDVLEQGDTVFATNGRAVLLFYGSVPAWRDLARGDTGPDVAQLNAGLVAIGAASLEQIDPASDEYTTATRDTVKRLQTIMGVKATGTISAGDIVYLPGSIRVTSVNLTLGASASPGQAIIEGTSTTPIVTITLPTARRAQVNPGDTVAITMPDLSVVTGTVSSVGTVATAGTSGSSATIPVEIALTDPSAAAAVDQAPVLVGITTASVADALVVPVTALLALAGGGYAVEVVGADGAHNLVPVKLGIFDDGAGLVQVTASGLTAGQHVVVPAT